MPYLVPSVLSHGRSATEGRRSVKACMYGVYISLSIQSCSGSEMRSHCVGLACVGLACVGLAVSSHHVGLATVIYRGLQSYRQKNNDLLSPTLNRV
jgi:hypothetical protein